MAQASGITKESLADMIDRLVQVRALGWAAHATLVW